MIDFLKQLKKILPQDCKPLIITDSGFRNPWFRAVLKMKWHFIGRVRHNTQYCDETKERWLAIKSLYKQASIKACAIGFVLLSRSSPPPCYFYLMKQKDLHYSFQANTEKHRNVLSCFVLGWQMLSWDRVGINREEILFALNIIIFSTVNWSKNF